MAVLWRLCRDGVPSEPGAAGPPAAAPRWGWGPGGPPAAQAAPAAGDAAVPAGPLPGPDQPVGFAAHVKPLFRPRDRQSMSFAFDLWSADDVRARATDIRAPPEALSGSVGQGSGKAEPWQDAGFEAGDGADLLAGEGQHEQAVRVGDRGVRVAQVQAERLSLIHISEPTRRS